MKIYRNKEEGFSSDSIKLAINRSNSTRALVEPMHGHDFLEIAFVIRGEASQIINGVACTVKKGDVIILRCGDTHSVTMNTGFEMLDCMIGDEVAADLNRQMEAEFHAQLTFLPNMIRLVGSEQLEVSDWFDMMYRECQEGADGHQVMIRSLLKMVLVKLYRHIQTFGEEITDDMSARILSYVDENFSSVTLSSIALHFGYSNSYFSRYFKKLFGVGLTTYINSLKVHRAEEIIKRECGNLTVEEICNRVGFKDRKHFCFLYKEYTGVTPSVALANYRKAAKKK